MRLHLQALTGLRFVAAFWVFLSHLKTPPGTPGWLATLVQSGYAGVTLFFVLSGFVMALNYTGRLSTRRELWSYAVARIARLYPLYLVVLTYEVVSRWGQLGRFPDHVLEHALALQAWDPDGATAFGLVGPAWSIGVELFLYATLPLLVLALPVLERRTRTLVLAAAVIFLIVLALAWWFHVTGRGDLEIRDPDSASRWLYRNPLTRVGDFALGILAARLFVRLRDRAGSPALGGWLVLGSIVTALLIAVQPGIVGSAWSWDATYVLPSIALILGLALGPDKIIARAFALPVMVLLGEASFAFYLVHKQIIDSAPAPRPWTVDLTVAAAAQSLSALLLAIVVALGLHVGLERPMRDRVRTLLDRPVHKHSA